MSILVVKLPYSQITSRTFKDILRKFVTCCYFVIGKLVIIGLLFHRSPSDRGFKRINQRLNFLTHVFYNLIFGQILFEWVKYLT